MNYQEILVKIPDWIQLAGVVLMFIVVAATIIVRIATFVARLTADPADDAKVARAQQVVNKAAEVLMNLMHIFPTLGKNPRTVQLEKTLEQVQEKPSDDASKAS